MQDVLVDVADDLCAGRGPYVDLLMSSLAIQWATSSGYGARTPRMTCRKPASMAVAIA